MRTPDGPASGDDFRRVSHLCPKPEVPECSIPVRAWGWRGLTPTILLIRSKSTKSTNAGREAGHESRRPGAHRQVRPRTLSDTMCLLISLRKSTSPQNRHLTFKLVIVYNDLTFLGGVGDFLKLIDKYTL